MFHLPYLLMIAFLRTATSLLVECLVFASKVALWLLSWISGATNWVIAWRNKSIESLMLKDKLVEVKSYSEWIKIAKNVDKLRGNLAVTVEAKTTGERSGLLICTTTG